MELWQWATVAAGVVLIGVLAWMRTRVRKQPAEPTASAPTGSDPGDLAKRD